MRLGAWFLPLLALSGCSGPPTRFYTLAAVGPGMSAPASGCMGDEGIAVHHVMLPETLDRQSLVRALGPDRLDISNRDRWAAPLDGMFQRVLADDLRDRLPPGRVRAPGDPEQAGHAAALDVNVRRFLADSEGRVDLQADWTLLDARGHVSKSGSESIGAGGSPATDAVVSAMSSAIGKLADRIAPALRCAPAGKTGTT